MRKHIKHIIIVVILLVICGAAGKVLYFAGYVQGSVKTAKRLHKTYLSTAMRLYKAFATNNHEQTEGLIELHVWMHSGALRSLIDNPYGYFITARKKSRVASDKAYERLLTKAEEIRKEMKFEYTRIETTNGTIHYLPPSVCPKERKPTAPPQPKSVFR